MTDFTGGPNDDLFNGTPDADVARGGEGNDELYGGGGDDHLMGEGGSDTLHGGAGIDWIDGGAGDDLLVLADGEIPVAGDRFTGGEGFDTLTVQSPPYPSSFRVDLTKAQFDADLEKLTGPQSIAIRPGQLTGFSVLDGNFALVGSGAIDLSGKSTSGWLELSNEGNQVILSADGFTQVVGLSGDDVIDGRAGTRNQTLSGSNGDDVILGGVGDDQLNGGLYFDRLEGGAGNDVLNGGGGAPSNDPYAGATVPVGPLPDVPPRTGVDTLIGGTGDDYYELFTGTEMVVELAGEGNDTVAVIGTSYTLPAEAEIETLRVDYSGTTAAINLTGNRFDNQIIGAAGDNILLGGDGNDQLYSGAGSDQLRGENGNDGIVFGANFAAGDIADGGAGTDTLVLQGSYANTSLAGISNVEVLLLASGADTRFGNRSGSSYSYRLDAVDSNIDAGALLIVVGSDLRASESLVYNGAAETNGAVEVFAGRGVDTLTGGAGNDGFFFGSDKNLTGADRIDGGAGFDSLALRGNYSGANAVAFEDASFIGIEVLTFLSGHSHEYGGANEPNGFDYDVTLANGNVAAGKLLQVIGVYLGADESLRFDGRAEADGTLQILSGAGDDMLYGGAGADTLYGGLGSDRLEGGAGADFYVYRNAQESTAAARDTIVFGAGDKIDLSFIDANANTPGNDGFAFIGAAAFSHVAGELRAYESAGSWFVEGDVNGDGVADLVIAVTSAQPLVSGDFIP